MQSLWRNDIIISIFNIDDVCMFKTNLKADLLFLE